MRTMLPLLLTLLAGACAPEAASTAAPAGAPAADPVAQQPATPPAAQNPTPTSYQAKRAPEFHFEDATAVPDAELENFHVTMKMSVDGKDVGTVTFDLWPEKAPKAVRNFLRYCDEGFYDGLLFHRILRDFMIQGGSPTNDGAGNGPHGRVPGEFSLDPRWNHRYGVLSMARSPDPDSASSQFFLCCDESDSTAGLNGQYTSFGRMVSGVAALEAVASVPTAAGADGGKSRPLKRAAIVEARVVKGAAPASDEQIARPAPADGSPIAIEVQHVLISWAGIPRVGAKRTREEAEALAADVLARAQKGEDFAALVRAHSDDPVQPGDETPGVYRMTADGWGDPKIFAGIEERMAQLHAKLAPMEAKVRNGEVSNRQWVQEVAKQLQASVIAFLQQNMSLPRSGMAPAFGDIGFNLKVGEIGMAQYDKQTSPFGIHVIKRIL